MFETEIATLNAHHAQLLKEHEGEYVSIVGDQIVGCFADAGDAWREGTKHTTGDVFVRRLINGPNVLMLPIGVRPVGP